MIQINLTHLNFIANVLILLGSVMRRRRAAFWLCADLIGTVADMREEALCFPYDTRIVLEIDPSWDFGARLSHK